jgi:hypothetical protein
MSDGFEEISFIGSFSGNWATTNNPDYGEVAGFEFTAPQPSFDPDAPFVYSADGQIFYRGGCLSMRLVPGGWPDINLVTSSGSADCIEYNFLGPKGPLLANPNVNFTVNGIRVPAAFTDFFEEWSLVGTATWDVNFS